MFDYLSKTKEAMRYPACFIALGFGTGLFRAAPGTFSTLLVGIPLYRLLSTLPPLYYGIILLFIFGIGVLVCSIAEEVFGNIDDSIIVWDEICGYLLTMAYAPKGFLGLSLSFILFRLFDILKPWPINWVEQSITGGLGIMLDDVLAAIYSWLVLYLLSCLL